MLFVNALLLRIDEPLYIRAILHIGVTCDWLYGSLLLDNIIFNLNRNIVYKVFFYYLLFWGTVHWGNCRVIDL